MLKKLIHYEYKASARLTALLLISFLGISVLMRFSLWCFSALSLPAFVAVIFTVFYGIALAALGVGIFLYMGFRFSTNLLGAEGYLTNTLPAPSWMLWFSKLVVHLSYAVLTYGATFFLFWLHIGFLKESSLSYEGILALTEVLGGPLGAACKLFFLVFCSSLATISMIYAALSLGNLFLRRRMLASFGIFVALYALLEIILSIFLTVFLREELNLVMNTATQTIPQNLGSVFSLAAVLDLLAACACLMVTQKIFSKHLNLI